MVTCQSSELGWEVTVEFPADFLSLGKGSVITGVRFLGHVVLASGVSVDLEKVEAVMSWERPNVNLRKVD